MSPPAPLPRRGVVCYYSFLRSSAPAPSVPRLSPSDSARLAAFGSQRRRSEFLLGRALAARCLRLLGERSGIARLSSTSGGRPCAPRGYSVSIAHRDGCVVAAVSNVGPVGVDVEAAPPAGPMRDSWWSYLSPDEAAELRALPGEERPGAFRILWTLKEAVLKACGVGLALPPSAVSLFVPAEGTDTPPSLRVAVCGVAPEKWHLRSFDAAGLRFGVALQASEAAQVLLREWRAEPS